MGPKFLVEAKMAPFIEQVNVVFRKE